LNFSQAAWAVPYIQKRFAEMGLINSPEEFDANIRAQIKRWAEVAKAAGIHWSDLE
jgi:tripartite-type tricarboxylate transporter receptor subunit TctC